MNKQIKALYDLAHVTYEYGGPTEIKSLDAEKFAELIVQECIKELETTKRCDPYTGVVDNEVYNNALTDGIANIKETFGVK